MAIQELAGKAYRISEKIRIRGNQIRGTISVIIGIGILIASIFFAFKNLAVAGILLIFAIIFIVFGAAAIKYAAVRGMRFGSHRRTIINLGNKK